VTYLLDINGAATFPELLRDCSASIGKSIERGVRLFCSHDAVEFSAHQPVKWMTFNARLKLRARQAVFFDRTPRTQAVTRKKRVKQWRKAIQKVAQLDEHIQATTTKSDFRFRLLVLAELHQKFH